MYCVIPAYNEARTVASVVEQAVRFADTVIVVDDGSTDATAAALEGLGASVIHHAHNAGKGAALSLGMRKALDCGAGSVVTLDADGQHRAQDIPLLLAAARKHPQRIIVAARMRGRARAPRLRRFANRFADFWISWAAGHRIIDSQSGFRLYPAAAAQAVVSRTGIRHGFVFESEALIEAAWRGFSSAHVEIESIYLANARPSHYRAVQDTAHIVRMVATRLLTRGMYPAGLLRSLSVRSKGDIHSS
ncbi:MAG: glycosyltransferase family 2 protein [Gammaproteobacteria bacterium]